MMIILSYCDNNNCCFYYKPWIVRIKNSSNYYVVSIVNKYNNINIIKS